MKSNQAYETVTLPSPSRPAAQVYTEPCPAFENDVQAHNWLVVFDAAAYMTKSRNFNTRSVVSGK